MKGKTIIFAVLGVGAAGLAVYFFTSSKPAAPKPTAAANPAGYAPGGNATANTVSQYLGIGQQAAQLFGTASQDVSNLTS